MADTPDSSAAGGSPSKAAGAGAAARTPAEDLSTVHCCKGTGFCCRSSIIPLGWGPVIAKCAFCGTFPGCSCLSMDIEHLVDQPLLLEEWLQPKTGKAPDMH